MLISLLINYFIWEFVTFLHRSWWISVIVTCWSKQYGSNLVGHSRKKHMPLPRFEPGTSTRIQNIHTLLTALLWPLWLEQVYNQHSFWSCVLHYNNLQFFSQCYWNLLQTGLVIKCLWLQFLYFHSSFNFTCEVNSILMLTMASHISGSNHFNLEFFPIKAKGAVVVKLQKLVLLFKPCWALKRGILLLLDD